MFYNPVEDEIFKSDILGALAGDNGKTQVTKDEYTYKDLRKSLKSVFKASNTTHIYIGSNKGGVGKSMLALQLAWMLNAKGFKVLLADFDAQANLTCSLLEDESKTEYELSFYDVLTGNAEFDDVIGEVADGFDLLASNHKLSKVDHFLREKEVTKQGSYFENDSNSDDVTNQIYLQSRDALIELGKNYDFVIYDTNPETNRFNRISMQVADLALVPIQAKESSVKAFSVTAQEIFDSFNTIDRDTTNIESRIKAVFNNINEIPEKKKAKVIETIYNYFRGKILDDYVNYNYELGEVCDAGLPAFCHEEIPLEIILNLSSVTDSVIRISNELHDNSSKPKKRRKHMFLSKEL